MAKRKRHYTAREFAEAIRLSHGLVSQAADRLGCHRMTVYSAIHRYESVRQALEDAREAMLDRAESKLFENIEKGDDTAIIFYLKCIGKQRGYVERQELTGADGGPLRVKGYMSVSPDDWPEEDDENSADG